MITKLLKLMYISTLDKRNSKIVMYGNLSLTSSWLFSTVFDFSWVAESFDRSKNWLELDRVDFSVVSFHWITINFRKVYKESNLVDVNISKYIKEVRSYILGLLFHVNSYLEVLHQMLILFVYLYFTYIL